MSMMKKQKEHPWRFAGWPGLPGLQCIKRGFRKSKLRGYVSA